MELCILRMMYRARYVLIFLFLVFIVVSHYKIDIMLKKRNTNPAHGAAPSETTESTQQMTLNQALDQLKPGSMEAVSAEQVRKLLNQSNGDFLGGGYVQQRFRDMSILDAQTLLHKKVFELQYECKSTVQYGKSSEGKYEVCNDEPFKSENGKCLVYTFGILRDWSFEDGIFKESKCELHTYDPSINQADHVRKEPNYFYHDLGVWDHHRVNDKDWTYDTLETMLKDNKQTEANIDVMKIHIEGSEWPMLNNMLETGSYKNIKQFSVTIHSPRWKLKQETTTLVDYAEIYDILERLEEVGFKKWTYQVLSPFCCTWFSELIPANVADERVCCYKLYYVNSKYL